ncbi:DUF6301 family protein [Streptomyces sp. NBC_00059]|uniref:DUF6301 family protein n=1 Tax=Streptomyces sp. NBC_00059 TaxID=2975635 RepID=UPI00224F0B36|nr:DUF6301 family protein [Streptomyces sp. NBC_00059]MCX5414949.1 DUF6301 family protein [Streptomyces sp. NBC_00059]
MIRPRWDVLDTGFGTAREASRDTAQEQMVERVRLRLTDYNGSWDQDLDAFARMTAALVAALGKPTDRKPGAHPEIHWAGADTTLVLEGTGGSVYLELATNNRLALDEELRQLDEEELL